MQNKGGTSNTALFMRLMGMDECELAEWVRVEVTSYLDALSPRFAGMPDCLFWQTYRSLMTKHRQARAA